MEGNGHFHIWFWLPQLAAAWTWACVYRWLYRQEKADAVRLEALADRMADELERHRKAWRHVLTDGGENIHWENLRDLANVMLPAQKAKEE